MISTLERLFNSQTDRMRAGRWALFRKTPRESLPRAVSMSLWFWGRLCLAFTAWMWLLLALLVLLGLLLPWSIKASGYQTSPFTIALQTWQLTLNDNAVRFGLFGAAISLPLLFMAACLPFHWAWNRRAFRLRTEGAPDVNEEHEENAFPHLPPIAKP